MLTKRDKKPSMKTYGEMGNITDKIILTQPTFVLDNPENLTPPLACTTLIRVRDSSVFTIIH